jgi:hypothetical protein
VADPTEPTSDQKWALSLIDQFATRSVGEAIWPTLRRPKVAAGLRTRVMDPDKINQSNTNVCGINGFVRDWAWDAPQYYAWFAIQLYETGLAALGRGHHANKIVKPSDDLRHARVPVLSWIDEETGLHEMNHADWIVLASIREAYNKILNYSGTERGFFGHLVDTLLKPFGASAEMIEGFTTPGTVVDTFKAAGYERVVDRANWWSRSDYNSLMEASSLLHDGWRVVLLINMRMLSKETEDTEALVATSDHWVGLKSTVDGDSVRGVRFQVQTWGEGHRWVPRSADGSRFLPIHAFQRNYYGFVAAKY